MSADEILLKLGWTPQLQGQFELLSDAAGLRARITSERPPFFVVQDEEGDEIAANLPGAWRFRAEGREDLPDIGDWVLIEKRRSENGATLKHLFDRKSCLVRKVAGREEKAQIIAANVDVAFIVTSLNADLNLRRLERYLAIVWESGATPVILLPKADLVPQATDAVKAVEAIAGGAEILPFSSLTNAGIDQLHAYLAKGKTGVVIGSSGVGKSTLVNRLIGSEVAATTEIREGLDKGRHTTTSRHLFRLPNGGLLIDTPGMRELGLWEAEGGVGTVFADVEAIAVKRRFTDCQHAGEPGCAIVEAVARGELDTKRVDSFKAMVRELAHQARKLDRNALSKQKAHAKTVTKAMRARLKEKK